MRHEIKACDLERKKLKEESSAKKVCLMFIDLLIWYLVYLKINFMWIVEAEKVKIKAIWGKTEWK